MQRMAKEHVDRILQEREKMMHELEAKRRELDRRTRELSMREVLTVRERQKLEEEKLQVTLLICSITIGIHQMKYFCMEPLFNQVNQRLQLVVMNCQ